MNKIPIAAAKMGTYSRSKWVGETDLVWTCSELFKCLALSYRSKTTFCAYDQKKSDDDNDGCNDNYDDNDGNFDDNDEKITKKHDAAVK